MQKTKPKSGRWMIIVSLIIAALLAICFFVGNYFYNFAIKAKGRNRENVGGPDFSERLPGNEGVSFLTSDFFETQGVQDAYISASQDGTELYSRVAENSASDAWVIVVHGYRSDGGGMSGYAGRFYKLGFSVLAPDLRGNGRSGGGYYGMGWDDRLDIIDWIDYLNESYDDPEIVLFGISMGGAAVMMTSGEKLPENVKAIIEDSGYSSIYAQFKSEIKTMYDMPAFPLLNMAGAVTQLRAGYNFMNEGDAVGQVAKSVTPILFIHGREDTLVPFSMLEEVYSAAACEREKLEVEGAGHGESAVVAPEIYWNTVQAFLSRHLDYNIAAQDAA